jgi:hypothetical protein
VLGQYTVLQQYSKEQHEAEVALRVALQNADAVVERSAGETHGAAADDGHVP